MKVQTLLTIFIATIFLTGCGNSTNSNTDMSENRITITSYANEVTETTTNIINIVTTETTTINMIFDENLKAGKIGNRGSSTDGGISEPNYINEVGYLATYISSTYPKADYINNSSWTINTYRQLNVDHYEINGFLPHKTKVKVISQNLTHTGQGNYSGILTVVNLSDNQQYLISVSDFVLNQYQKNNIVDAIKDGAVLCQYNNANKNYLPCDSSHEIVNLPENTKVLAVSKTGLASGLNSEALNISCYYYNKYNEYTELYINEDDLKILY